jgi:hypothetical protein
MRTNVFFFFSINIINTKQYYDTYNRILCQIQNINFFAKNVKINIFISKK